MHIARASEPHLLLEDWQNFGPDYDRTLMAWLVNFDARWGEVADRYNERTRRMFRYYLSVCAGAFRARHLQLWQVLFSRRSEERRVGKECRCMWSAADG